MAYLDLGEVPEVMESLSLLGSRRFAPASFRRKDHLGPEEQPLTEAVRELVWERTGMNVNGSIRLLTQLRYFGYYFSPLNLFFCYDEEGTGVDAIVAEVSNTPWRERHYYVLWEGNRSEPDGGLAFSHPKEFHVSPFIGMDVEYRWQLKPPSDQLQVQLSTLEQGKRFFGAEMSFSRRPLENRQLARMLLRYPIMTARIAGAIYFQALKLRIKKCPFYAHPKKIAKHSAI
jgi:DUF1365 family protein